VADGGDVSVVTLNLAKEVDADRIVRELRAVPTLAKADVFLLQEVKQAEGSPQCAGEQLAKRLGLHAAYAPAAPEVRDQGLAILSRFPLRDIKVQPLGRYNLGFHSRVRFALEATADTPWGEVRIVNTHLDTRLNTRDRLSQVEPAIRATAGFRGPRILGGDFNSNRFYWIGHVLPLPSLRPQSLGVADFMTREGFESAVPSAEPTFDYLGMHLDWIWLAGLHARAHRVYPLEFSDHHAVWTRVAF
jgi:endonuclease/exonuclease/phosphatase family metal-dependent hydrolase